jgi:hypothetical protein
MISSSSLREHLWFEHAGALRRETPRAGCALIKRPHLSAVSFLKSDAGFLAGAPLLRCNRSQAAKKRNYGAPQKACQASPLARNMERSLDFPWTPFASTTCGDFQRGFAASRTPVQPCDSSPTRPSPGRGCSRSAGNRFVAVQFRAATRCTTITLERVLVTDAPQALVSGA